MYRDSAVDLLMGRLANRTHSATRQNIVNEMVFVQENVLEGDATLFWFLLSSQQTLTTVADQEYLAHPVDFLQEWDEGGLYYVDDDGDQQLMIKDDWDTIKERITGTGRPKYYALAGEQFLFRKLPDDAYTIYWRYYAAAGSLAGTYGSTADTDGNVENLWLKWASDLLIAETGIIIAEQYLQSEKMMALFQKQADAARVRLIKKDTAMREVNVQRFMEG